MIMMDIENKKKRGEKASTRPKRDKRDKEKTIQPEFPCRPFIHLKNFGKAEK